MEQAVTPPIRTIIRVAQLTIRVTARPTMSEVSVTWYDGIESNRPVRGGPLHVAMHVRQLLQMAGIRPEVVR
jgi:hypothetical protein